MIKNDKAINLISALLITVLVFAFTGCGAKNKSVSTDIKKTVSSSLQVESKIQNTSPQTIDNNDVNTIQDKQSISIPEVKKLKDIFNKMGIELLTLGMESTSPITDLVGNHAQIISKEEITLNSGPALLVLIDRTNSAADQVKENKVTHSYEYWLFHLKLSPYPEHEEMRLAYVLHANLNSLPTSDDRSNLLEIAKGWKISD